MPAGLSTSNPTTSMTVTLVNDDALSQLDTGISLAELEGREPAEQVRIRNTYTITMFLRTQSRTLHTTTQ